MIKKSKHVEDEMRKISEKLLSEQCKHSMLLIADLKNYINTIKQF